MRIIGLPGSLRANSVNRRLLEAATPVLPPGAVLDIYDGIGQLPLFDEDLEGEAEPRHVAALRAALGGADGVLIATPEYNGSLPGPLKNTLDWASRPHGRSVLQGKPVAVVGASPSRFGAVRAQADARRIAASIGARVLDRELPVAQAFSAFDADGHLIDQELEARYASLLADLARLAESDHAAAHAA